MSQRPSDSFLPSGAIDSPRRVPGRFDSVMSPFSVPRTMPDHIPSPHDSSKGSPDTISQSRSPSQHLPPMSPPRTRSASAEPSNAALVVHWKEYAENVRRQFEGEKAHMLADRARADELVAEERLLFEEEKRILQAQIAEMQAELEKVRAGTSNPLPTSPPKQRPNAVPISYNSSNAVSMSGSIDGSACGIPQESGRNADGTPFYAPAPRNPSRTFEASELDDLKVDSMTAPQETPIRVTSKELTSSDFGPQKQRTPPSAYLSPIQESSTPMESIDISHIQPGLDGVAIKATAVSPTFAAKVLSPQRSPPKLSPDVKPPGRDVTTMTRSLSANSPEEKTRKTLEVVSQPENRRLTIHAGHTPNHSLTKFPFLNGSESGGATPTQAHHGDEENRDPGRKYSLASEYEDFDKPAPPGEENQHEQEHDEQGDKELSGPLGLTSDAVKNDAFLAQLTERLAEEARKSADASPSSGSSSSRQSQSDLAASQLDGQAEEDTDDGPPLRMKPSINFGRPMGRL